MSVLSFNNFCEKNFYYYHQGHYHEETITQLAKKNAYDHKGANLNICALKFMNEILNR